MIHCFSLRKKLLTSVPSVRGYNSIAVCSETMYKIVVLRNWDIGVSIATKLRAGQLGTVV